MDSLSKSYQLDGKIRGLQFYLMSLEESIIDWEKMNDYSTSKLIEILNNKISKEIESTFEERDKYIAAHKKSTKPKLKVINN